MKRLPLVLSLIFVSASALSADNWPNWRGPLSSGVSPETGLPTAWSATENIAWKITLDGAGVSSPVVWNDRVIVTTQRGSGVRKAGNHPSLVQGADAATAGEKNLTGAAAGGGDVTFVTTAYRWSDGSRVWQHELAAEGPLPAVHDKHNLATPSPVTDGDVTIAWFATGQAVALDPGGKALWTKHLGRDYSPFDINWGHASSPVLHGDTAFFLCYHDKSSYVLALDKKTGATKWKVDRPIGRISYSTPIIVDTPSGAELIVNDSMGLEALEASTGKSRWSVREDSRFPIPVGTAANGVYYTTRGYRSGPVAAIKLGGSGDVSTSHIAWRIATGAPYVSSMLHYNGLLYLAGELGVVSVFDAATGERVSQQRVGGVFTASPVAGDGKVFLVSETGEVVVLKAGRAFEILARNKLDAHLVASPAISRGRIFLRGDAELFAVGK
jgi:outer membrane protein assembly factor BamB